MKGNRIIWGFVSFVVLTTIAITTGTMDSKSQEKPTSQAQSTQSSDNRLYEDLHKYAVAEYDSPVSRNVDKSEKRKLANQRYDDQGWVLKNPHPDDGGVGRYDEDDSPPPPIFPVDESVLVVVGKIVDAKAYLSNDKSGVYTEFSIRVDQVLKNDVSQKVELGAFVSADRAGGFVLYPNGQKVLYRHSELGLPIAGSEYAFFLTNDKRSPNYGILTLYELSDSGVVQLDPERRFDEFKGVSKRNFTEAIRNKISRSSQPINRNKKHDQ